MQLPKPFDRIRQTVHFWHLSHKAQKFYVYHLRDFILFHQRYHPKYAWVHQKLDHVR